MPDTTDNGAPSAFVFPASPQDAVLCLAILVEEVQGEGLLLSASTTPGDQTWGHSAAEELFRQARMVPQPGTYVFQANDSGVVYVSGPEEVGTSKACDLVFFLTPAMRQRRDQLVAALQAFPTQEVIDEAARRIVAVINIGSLERNPLEVKPVVDARIVEVEAVDCVDCGFGIEAILGLAISALFGSKATIDDGTTKVDGIKFGIRAQDDLPVVQVGYLSHSSDFAGFLNGVLAERVRASVQTVAVEVMTQVLVKAELGRRQFERVIDSVQATYGLDPATIASRVNALEEEARARLAPPPEADGDYVDDDASGGDLLDEELEEPAPESAAPTPAG